MIRKIIILNLILFIAVLCASCASEQETTAVTQAAVAVSGETISSKELEYFENRFRADVISEYQEKYSLFYENGFWDIDVSGKTPQKELQERALEAAIKAKIQFVMMKDENIYEDISFDGLYNKAIAYNAENKDKIGVPGINTVHMDSFYSYYLSNGIMELKNKFSETKLKPNEADIELMMESLIDQYPDFKESELKKHAVEKLIDKSYDEMISKAYENFKTK